MTLCPCGASEEPPTVQGMKLELPTGWSVMTIARAPIVSRYLCPKCLHAVEAALRARRTLTGATR